MPDDEAEHEGEGAGDEHEPAVQTQPEPVPGREIGESADDEGEEDECGVGDCGCSTDKN